MYTLVIMMLVLASGCWTAPPPYYDYQLQNNYRYANHPNQYYVQRHDSQEQYPVYATEEQKTTQQETFAPEDLKYSHVPAESPAHSVSTSSSPIVVTEPFHVSKKLESAIRSIAPLQPHGVNYQLHYQPQSQYSKAYTSYQTDQQQQLQHPHFAPQYYHEAPNLYSKPPSHSQVSKDIYVHVPPAEMEAVEQRQHYVQPPPRKHYRIVFIKAPTRNAAPVQPVQPVEEKTIIYVLTKKADPVELQTILEKQKPLKTNKPEVFFIKYKNNEEAQQAQETIKAEFDKLGGQSHVAEEIVAPVANAGVALNSKMIAAIPSVETEKISDNYIRGSHDEHYPSNVKSKPKKKVVNSLY